MRADTFGARLHGLVLRISTGWAILGGLLLLAVVLVNTASVVGAAFFGAALPDFELTELGVAVAVFAFLPYCQIAGLNVTADIFTSGASKRWVAAFSFLAAVVALAFGVIMLWRMYAGMVDQREYDATTALLQIPLWWPYAACLASLALLAVASLASLIDAAEEISGRS